MNSLTNDSDLNSKNIKIEHSKSAPVKSSLAYMMIKVFEKGIAVISIPIFTRILTQEQYGLISLYASWVGLLSAIITLGFPAGAFNVGLVEFDKDKDRFTSSLLGLTSALSMIFIIVLLVFNSFLSDLFNLPPILLYFMGIHLFFKPAKGFFLLRERFDYKFKKSIIIVIAAGILTLLLSLIAVLYVESNQGIAKVLGTVLAVTIINVFLYFYLLSKGKMLFNWHYWKYGILFNVPLIPHYLSNFILSQSDRIMISKFSGNADVGIYSMIYTAVSTITIIWSSINASLIPWTLKNLSIGNYSYIKRITKIILMICALTSIGFMMIAPEVIKVFAPSNYYEGIYIIPPITLGIYFTFVYSLFVNVEYYHKKTTFISFASIAAAALNVLLNLIFIPIYGYVAAAYTTLIAYVFYTVLHYYTMRKTEKNDVYDIKFIIGLSLALTLFSFVIMKMYEYYIIRYALILLCLIVLGVNYKKIIILIKNLR